VWIFSPDASLLGELSLTIAENNDTKGIGSMLQPESFPQPFRKIYLKPVSWAVILAEILDITTTFGGFLIYPQMWEANPLYGFLGGWGSMILAKIAATVIVVLILEKVVKWPRPVWVIPLAASLPVFWNTASILAELLL
jgi:hypothetical protein